MLNNYETELEKENWHLREMIYTIIGINQTLRDSHSELKISHSELRDSYHELMTSKESARERVIELRKYTELLAENLQKRELEIGDLQDQINSGWMP